MIGSYFELVIRALLSNKLMIFYTLFILSSSVYGCLKKSNIAKSIQKGVSVKFIENVTNLLEFEDLNGKRLSVSLDGVILPKAESGNECQVKSALIVQNKIAGLLSSSKVIRLVTTDSKVINGNMITYGRIQYDGNDLATTLTDLKLVLHHKSSTNDWCKVLHHYDKE